MLAASIDDRGDGLAVDIVEPSADQPEALGCQVDDRRRDVELAVEPWFHRVLVARLHVGQVVAPEASARAPTQRRRARAGPDPFE